MKRRLWVSMFLALTVACSSKSNDAKHEPTQGSATPGSASSGSSAPADAAAVTPPDAPEVAPVVVPVTAPARKLYSPKLETAEEFEAYSKELGGERFAKFVIDLKSDAIYYFDVDVYKVHKDFIFQELYKKPKTKEAVRVFDKNYTANKVDFMMCYLVHHLAQDVWTFAFWDGDLATPEHVTHAYKRMKETFFKGDVVKYRPDSSYQEAVAKKLKDVPFILNDALYQAADYVAFNQGSAIGKLRLVPLGVAESELTFDPGEVVVLTTPLADITPVAGIISEQFSTPLSHVSLRAKAWQIPNIGLHGARAKLAPLDGKTVLFEARGGEYTLREATPEEIAAKQKVAHKTVDLPVADLAFGELLTLDQFRAKDVVRFGAKAANLGEIVASKPTLFEVPPGFGIPYRYYAEHMAKHGLDKKLAAMLADPVFAKDANVRKKQLAELKKAIMDAPVADDLKAKVTTALAALPGADGGAFVRSSGNAEDLDQFNGAGLYDTVPNMRGPDQVLTAVKQVWGSIWNFVAFEDRQRAGIDHSKTYSSVLVQTGVPATAAGVLVTEHPTDPTDEKNYTINAKSGLGMSVVDGKKVPESLIVSWYNHGIRVLSRSAEDTKLVFDEKGGIREVPNPDAGKPVLSNTRAILLADSARKLTKVFKNDHLDVEWVFVGEKLYVVQTRPLVR
ncbi:MAG: PEP/pyruvate-binding domain-containing protein [Myxococcales bacterium]|nr:PEP/pyruvate-binding domain-containing protein [Myxococcales bacterium]